MTVPYDVQFKDGVLRITLSKPANAQAKMQARKIAVNKTEPGNSI